MQKSPRSAYTPVVFLRRFSWVGEVLLLVTALWPPSGLADTNLSAWAWPGPGGRLICRPDSLGNRLLDYSGVGYRGGTVPLPSSNIAPVRVTISPVVGDNAANLQDAINQVSALPLDTNGFRGAVLLTAGEYPLSRAVRITASGVVLRGAGSGTNGTILRATATNQYTLISVAGSGSASTVSGTTHLITNSYVPVGARSFLVDSTSGLAVGDHIFVRRVATSNWIHDLGMDLLCCPPDVNPWTPSGYNIDSDRVITRLEGNRVFVDAPLTCAIDAGRYTNGTIRKFTWAGRLSNVGLEHLRGVSDYASSTDENHGWTFIQFNSTENGWARDVTSQWFGYSCVALSSGAKFITVADCQCLDPISLVTGGRRYAFVLDDCTLCLVQNCYTKLDRHQFVTQSLTTGPNVFVDGWSDSAQSDAGPHHRWGTGALWDNVIVNGNNINVQNRGNLGSGHGWAGANELLWNCKANGFVVQNPPGARNWLIGSIGTIQNGTVYVGPHDPGTYDSSGSSGANVFPNSIYYAQLQDRLAAPNLQTRDYWLGQINGFTNAGPAGDAVTVSAGWRVAVQTAAGSAPLDGFDVVATNHWVPFSFTFQLATNEHILAATLAVSLLATNGNGTNCVLYLDSLTNTFDFDSLGWLPISAVVSNPTVRVLDLSSQLGLLGDGQLNVAVEGGVGIDWAMLELQVAPTLRAMTNCLEPAADAFVQGGPSANLNFGTSTSLMVKEDTSINVERKAYLRWDLGSVVGPVLQARVRLFPIDVGTNGLEHGVALARSNNWAETGITWNNQPGSGKRFATWIPGVGVPVEIDVTPQVQDALNNDRQLSLQIFSLRPAGGPGLVSYASREYTDAAARPQLMLTTPVANTNSSGLADADIGGVNPAGSSTYADGIFTLSGGGNDIWGNADQFHFTYLPLTNDYCHVIARVMALDPVNAWTKCGVMLRESLDPGAAHAMTVTTPSNGVNFMYRSASGGSTAYTKVSGQTPIYLGIVRAGANFTSWYSPNGASWSQIGSAQNIPMGSPVYAGLCLSSHVVGTLATATLDHLQIGALMQPVLTPVGGQGGQFSIQIIGDVGPSYLIQSSSDFLNWSTVAISRPALFPFNWSTSSVGTCRFYRVVLGP